MIDVQIISIINYLSIAIIFKNLDNYNGYTDTLKVGDTLFFSYLNSQVENNWVHKKSKMSNWVSWVIYEFL